MFGFDDLDPYDRTAMPLRLVAIFAAGLGIAFGLCSVGLEGHGSGSGMLAGLGLLVFAISFIGFAVSAVWLVVAFLIKTFQGE